MAGAGHTKARLGMALCHEEITCYRNVIETYWKRYTVVFGS
jgi:hypothetical protein